ncbi:MAG: DUF4381 domain-containing protein [Gammaproteobacteria bacterium]|nr:DUF4381 domain-containing protein [Gammaproteobacteria bacterium]
MAPVTAEQALQLRDIHLPPSPPWWPPAPGWWVLAIVVSLLLGYLAWRGARAWRHRRRLHALQRALDDIERALLAAPAPQPLARLSALLKRVALSRHPRGEVAALSGHAWLSFLDRTGGDGAFVAGPAQVLAEGVYQARIDDALDVPGLMVAVRRWVDRNIGVPQ